MKRSALFVSVGAVVMLLASGAMAKQDKVDVCHVPPGNPDNAHTISVGAPAVPAHLVHGDSLGPCLVGVEITCICNGQTGTISGCGPAGCAEIDLVCDALCGDLDWDADCIETGPCSIDPE